MKYKVGDKFYLDGKHMISDEMIEIHTILNANDKIKEDKYLCIYQSDIIGDGNFNNVCYWVFDDNILDNCGYKLIK